MYVYIFSSFGLINPFNRIATVLCVLRWLLPSRCLFINAYAFSVFAFIWFVTTGTAFRWPSILNLRRVVGRCHNTIKWDDTTFRYCFFSSLLLPYDVRGTARWKLFSALSTNDDVSRLFLFFVVCSWHLSHNRATVYSRKYKFTELSDDRLKSHDISLIVHLDTWCKMMVTSTGIIGLQVGNQKAKNYETILCKLFLIFHDFYLVKYRIQNKIK